MTEIEQFETHMDRMDREAQQQRADLAIEQERTRRAKVEARKDTKEVFLVVACSFIAAAFVLAVLGLIYKGVAGPSAEEVQRQEHIAMCYENGGEWEPARGGDEYDDDYVEASCDLSPDSEEE